MATATVNDTIIADSSDTADTVVVEGNHYFPIESVTVTLEPTDHTTRCPWKGDASHFDVIVGDTRLANAAWSYPSPKQAATEIANHIAFYPPISVNA